MVKHIRTIRQLLQKNCLSVFDHFAGFALKGLSSVSLPDDLKIKDQCKDWSANWCQEELSEIWKRKVGF